MVDCVNVFGFAGEIIAVYICMDAEYYKLALGL